MEGGSYSFMELGIAIVGALDGFQYGDVFFDHCDRWKYVFLVDRPSFFLKSTYTRIFINTDMYIYSMTTGGGRGSRTFS